jgi:hypothetical protein
MNGGRSAKGDEQQTLPGQGQNVGRQRFARGLVIICLW